MSVKALFPFFLCHPITIAESHTGKPDLGDRPCKERSQQHAEDEGSICGGMQPASSSPATHLCWAQGRRGRTWHPAALGVTNPSFTPAAICWMTAWAKCHLGCNAGVSRGTGWKEAIRLLFSQGREMGTVCFRKPVLQQHVKGNFSCTRRRRDLVHQASLPLPWAWPAPMTSLDPLQDCHDCYLYLFQLTRTSCWGKGPLEFSGTLMGGMTQSRFCLRRPFALWCWRQGSRVSLCCCARSMGPLFLPFGCFGSKKANPVSFRLLIS